MMNHDEIISCDRDTLGGTPVFTGTRVPVDSLIAHLKAGDSLDEFLVGFPAVSREQAEAFLELALKAAVVEGRDTHAAPHRRIIVVPYDSRWPLEFERAAGEVSEAMGGNLRALYHIGSTSIPGIHAKPVIDMLPVVEDLWQARTDSSSAWKRRRSNGSLEPVLIERCCKQISQLQSIHSRIATDFSQAARSTIRIRSLCRSSP